MAAGSGSGRPAAPKPYPSDHRRRGAPRRRTRRNHRARWRRYGMPDLEPGGRALHHRGARTRRPHARRGVGRPAHPAGDRRHGVGTGRRPRTDCGGTAVSAPDTRGPLQVARRAQLLEALRHDGVLRVSDLSGRLGAAAVTIRRDIAQLAAEGLVRRVHGGVALPEFDEDAAVEDSSAAAPSSGTRTLGMLVPSLDYYWPDVARGAEDAARELHARIVLRGSSYETEDDKPQLIRLVETLNVDGLIVAPRMDAPTAERTVEWLVATGMPVVLIERTATVGPHHAVVESVVTDHALGAAMAVRHLVSLGHQKVGVLLGEHSPTSPHVRRGWLEAITD